MKIVKIFAFTLIMLAIPALIVMTQQTQDIRQRASGPEEKQEGPKNEEKKEEPKQEAPKQEEHKDNNAGGNPAPKQEEKAQNQSPNVIQNKNNSTTNYNTYTTNTNTYAYAIITATPYIVNRTNSKTTNTTNTNTTYQYYYSTTPGVSQVLNPTTAVLSSSPVQRSCTIKKAHISNVTTRCINCKITVE